MIKTLKMSFALKITYRVNSIIYSLKQIPLIKKLIPGRAYQMRGFKVFAAVLSWIWEVISAFLGKLIYFLTMIVGALSLLCVQEGMEASAFLHILIFLSIIGAFANTYMFNPTKDKYYAIVLLGMNAKEYTLVNYFYAIIKLLFGFGLFGVLFGLGAGLSLWECILIPFFVASGKLIYAALELREYETKQKTTSENKLGVARWILMLVLLALAYGLPFLGVILPRMVSIGILCAVILLGVCSLRKMIVFSQYRPMYQEILSDAMNMYDPAVQKAAQQKNDQKNISTDTSITSDKKGFEYLNELFIKRHRRILWNSAIKITVGAAAVIAVVLIVFAFNPEAKKEINKMMLNFLPYFVFVMYIVNRGTGFTRALFVNCDHSLLTYSFYKEPKLILKLFRIRLKEIMKVNLLPAVTIGAGLALLLFASGGTGEPLNYLVLIVSIVCLSIFFSVHYLTLYYLLQPYNAATEMKSGTYQVLMSLTYLVCYFMIQFELPTIAFGLATILFCVIYCGVACLLVYKIAPKTFRIR